MHLVTSESVQAYLAHDTIGRALDASSEPRDEHLTSQRWLRDTPAKRMIFASLYGDLLAANGSRVLDVGGGLTALTRRMARAHDYVLVDFMAHENPDAVDDFTQSVGRNFIAPIDWDEYQPDAPFDLVVANDIFPNVDQRLELFLDRFLPVAKRIRLSLTYYNEPRFYKARRINGEEILCVMAWNGQATKRAIERFADRIDDVCLEAFETNPTPVFANGRQVCLVQLRGDA